MEINIDPHKLRNTLQKSPGSGQFKILSKDLAAMELGAWISAPPPAYVVFALVCLGHMQHQLRPEAAAAIGKVFSYVTQSPGGSLEAAG